MSMSKIDLKKELKHLYQPSAKEVVQVEVPAFQFLMIDGEGDPNTSPKETQALADLVKGSKFWPMKDLGHFPVTENYSEFRKYLLPILEDIQQRS